MYREPVKSKSVASSITTTCQILWKSNFAMVPFIDISMFRRKLMRSLWQCLLLVGTSITGSNPTFHMKESSKNTKRQKNRRTSENCNTWYW